MLKCPDTKNRSLGWHRREFPTSFCGRHEELQRFAPEEMLIHYACRFSCSEKMMLAAQLGYDGPIKIWVDGKEIYYDPRGTNPALPGEKVVEFSASAGEHEMVISLSSNKGLAWGIYLRFERLDLSKRLLVKGSDSYAMPEFLK